MTTATLSAPRRSASFFAAIAGFFKSVGISLVVAAESQTRMQKIERLQALSDAELAERGLTRDAIVQHVFRDIFYL